MANQFAAVIFDLDGLVLDTEATYFSAWKLAASDMGYKLTDEFCDSLSGLHYPAVQKKLSECFGKSFDVDTFNRNSSRCWLDYVSIHGVEVKKGFHSLLDLIQKLNIPYSLATNSLQINAEQCLALAGLEQVFPLKITRDQVAQGKPAPDLFLMAAEKMSMPIRHCLALEDSSPGIIAAARAGAYTAYIPSASIPDLKAVDISDYHFDSLDGVVDLVRANFAQ